jgi:hypothetical protein
MKVSSSGYYGWLNRPIDNRSLENQRLTKSIKEVLLQNRHVYGTRIIAQILAKNQIVIAGRN